MWKSILHLNFVKFLWFFFVCHQNNSTARALLPNMGITREWRFFSAFYNWQQTNQLIFLHCLLQIIKSNRSSISSITFWSLYSYYGPPYNNRESRNNKVTDFFTYYNRQLQMMQLIFSFYYGQPLTSKLWWFFNAY